MAKQTRVYFTLVVERYGRSGPENEKCIEKFVESLENAQNPKDKYMEVSIDSHHYDTVHESVD